MEKDLKPSLKQFLVKHRAYKRFLKNLGVYNERLIEEINNSKGFDCFACAFIWDNVQEHYTYWYKLAEKFNKIDK